MSTALGCIFAKNISWSYVDIDVYTGVVSLVVYCFWNESMLCYFTRKKARLGSKVSIGAVSAAQPGLCVAATLRWLSALAKRVVPKSLLLPEYAPCTYPQAALAGSLPS